MPCSVAKTAIEITLQRQIVNRVHAAGAGPDVARRRGEPCEEQRGVPVVRVDGVGAESEVRRAGDECVAEEEEALDVIVGAVHRWASEVSACSR